MPKNPTQSEERKLNWMQTKAFFLKSTKIRSCHATNSKWNKMFCYLNLNFKIKFSTKIDECAVFFSVSFSLCSCFDKSNSLKCRKTLLCPINADNIYIFLSFVFYSLDCCVSNFIAFSVFTNDWFSLRQFNAFFSCLQSLLLFCLPATLSSCGRRRLSLLECGSIATHRNKVNDIVTKWCLFTLLAQDNVLTRVLSLLCVWVLTLSRPFVESWNCALSFVLRLINCFMCVRVFVSCARFDRRMNYRRHFKQPKALNWWHQFSAIIHYFHLLLLCLFCTIVRSSVFFSRAKLILFHLIQCILLWH